MSKNTENAIKSSLIVEWRRLRNGTMEHPVGCPCKDCSNRRKTGARLNMPYAGPVLDCNTSLRTA